VTDEKILNVIDRYERLLQLAGSGGIEPTSQFDHIITMLPKMRVFLTEGRREKLMRWLGFIQGALWAEGVYTIEELSEHNWEPEP
jgi:hypothetical protein